MSLNHTQLTLVTDLYAIHQPTVDMYRAALSYAPAATKDERDYLADGLACSVKHSARRAPELEFLVYQVPGALAYFPLRELRDENGRHPRTAAPAYNAVREVTEDQLREWLAAAKERLASLAESL